MKNRKKIGTLALAVMVAVAAAGSMAEPAHAASAASQFKKTTVKATSLTAGYKQITVKWKKVKKADGYQVYRATRKAGKYKKVKTLKKAAAVKFVNKKLKAGKTYYFKVRAYKKIKGKTVYSKYSKALGKKTLTELEAKTDAFIKAATKGKPMKKEQKLQACYTYMRNKYEYIMRDPANTSNNKWINPYATKFFKTQKGNCYSWAAAYTTVAKRLGYSAKAKASKCFIGFDPNNPREHAWTEISIGGKTYVFDPERDRVSRISLYKINKDSAKGAVYR